MKKSGFFLSVVLILSVSVSGTYGFVYVLAGETYGVDVITHPDGYTGSSGNLTITVGVAQSANFSAEAQQSIIDAINTWNNLTTTTGNLGPGGIPSTYYDFESVVIHEMGHALGLAHPNLASESGLPSADQRYAKTTDGPNNTYNLAPGIDGVIGTADDVRGDDVNLCWYETSELSNSDPFDANPGTVDSTTFSRPDSVDNTSTREAAGALSYSNTESVMTQGTWNGETQRSLTADDVAGILYAQSGIDELASGTGDNYTYTLTWMGERASDDVDIYINWGATSFAVTQSWLTGLGSDHWAITSSDMLFNQSINWWNDAIIPEPVSGMLVLTGLAFMLVIRRRG